MKGIDKFLIDSMRQRYNMVDYHVEMSTKMRKYIVLLKEDKKCVRFDKRWVRSHSCDMDIIKRLLDCVFLKLSADCPRITEAMVVNSKV